LGELDVRRASVEQVVAVGTLIHTSPINVVVIITALRYIIARASRDEVRTTFAHQVVVAV